MTRVLRAATRGSKLALWQTNRIAELLGVEIELVIVQTTGDKTQKQNIPLEQIGGQGVFVKEVQTAVLEGRADFAVHSAKDLPSSTDAGLVLASVPERGDARDALLGTALADLPDGAVIATGSIRRKAQLLALRPDLNFVGLRGNVDTRVQKVKDHDAVVMAYAPIQRLDISDVSVDVLDVETMLPQVSQGALAVECREDDSDLIEFLSKIQHEPTRRAVNAERAFLASMGTGCDLPVGGHAVVLQSGELLLRALIATHDGSTVLREEATGTDPIELGQSVGKSLLSAGGHELLSVNRDGK